MVVVSSRINFSNFYWYQVWFGILVGLDRQLEPYGRVERGFLYLQKVAGRSMLLFFSDRGLY